MVAWSLQTRLSETLSQTGWNVKTVQSADEVTPDADLLIADSLTISQVKRIKSAGSTKIAIADPKIKTRPQILLAQLCDFALVGSIEHRKALDTLGVASELFTFIPSLAAGTRPLAPSLESKRLVLGYHGNKVHLETFAKRTLKVIDTGIDSREIELRVFYNIKALGLWKPGRLRNIHVIHNSWHPTETYQELAKVDVGLVPNSIPHLGSPYAYLPKQFSNPMGIINRFGIRHDDYDTRFKITSNPGRIYPFGKVGVPVIADFFPSSASLIRDGIDGFLCLNDDNWLTSIQRFANDSSLISRMGESLRNRIEQEFDSKEAKVAFSQQMMRCLDT